MSKMREEFYQLPLSALDDYETHVRLAKELIEQWAQTWNAFQPVAAAQIPPSQVQAPAVAAQLTPAQQQVQNFIWGRSGSLVPEVAPDPTHGPGDGVTTCKDCGYKLTELFMSKACDRCDGLLKPEPVKADSVRYALCFMNIYEVKNQLPMYASRTVPTREEALEWVDKIQVTYPSDRFGLLTIKMGECTHVDRLIWNEEQRRDASDSLILLLEGNI